MDFFWCRRTVNNALRVLLSVALVATQTSAGKGGVGEPIFPTAYERNLPFTSAIVSHSGQGASGASGFQSQSAHQLPAVMAQIAQTAQSPGIRVIVVAVPESAELDVLGGPEMLSPPGRSNSKPVDVTKGEIVPNPDEQGARITGNQTFSAEGQARSLTVIHNGANDQVLSSGLAAKIGKMKKIELIDVGRASIAFGKKWLEKIKDKTKTAEAQNVKSGVLVAVAAAGLFSSTFYITSSVEVGLQVFLVAMILNLYQSLFSKQWNQVLASGGDLMVKATKVVRSLVRLGLGKAQSDLELSADSTRPQVLEKLGQLISALAINLSTTVLYLSLSDSLVSAWLAFSLAAVGTYDLVWDLVMGNLNRRNLISDKTLEKFTRSRLIVGSTMESMSFALQGTATVILGVVLSSGLVTLFSLETPVEDKMRRVVRGIIDVKPVLEERIANLAEKRRLLARQVTERVDRIDQRVKKCTDFFKIEMFPTAAKATPYE